MATMNDILKKAQSFIGTKESPSGSNNVIFNTHYYGGAVSGSAYAWCCVFVWDVFRLCNASNLFYDGKKTAYCPTLQDWGKKKGLSVSKSSGKAGDIVLFDWNGNGLADHVGIIEKKNDNGTYTTIEGNTSLTSNDNGGCVMRRTRKQSEICAIIRPLYDKETTSANTAITHATKTVAIDSAKSFQKSLSGTYKVTASSLNVRKGAGVSKGIITTIPKETKVNCYGYYTSVLGTRWLYIQFTYMGTLYTGFASSKYLAK